MKQILLKIAFFFSLMATPLVTLFILPYSEEFAYHYIEHDCYNHGAWIYDRIAKNPTPIGVAMIGSSHTLHAFQDKKTEELIGLHNPVTNLGYCRYGRNMEYLILKMLLKFKSPKLIIIEVHEDEEKNSHDIFPYLAQTDDLILTPTTLNRDYLSDLFNGASARLEYFKAKYIFRKQYPKPDFEPHGYAAEERTVSEIEWNENISGWMKRLQQTEPEIIEKAQLKYPFAYLEKMVRLIKAKNIPFVFVYLPDSGSKLKYPKYAEHYKNIAPLLIPPQSILDDRSNWMDASHLNNKGSAEMSVWLAEEIKKEMCLDRMKPN
jgi:hypothetical protein